MQAGEIKNNKSVKGALINIQRGDMYFTGGKVYKNFAPNGLLKRNKNGILTHVGGKVFIETPIKLSKLGVSSSLVSGSKISIYNPNCKLLGSKKDIYSSKKYRIKKSDLKHIKHQNLISRLSKKGEVYFVVKTPRIEKISKKGKVIFKWKNVPFAKKYKILKNGKNIKIILNLKRGKKLDVTIIPQGSNGYYGKAVKIRAKAK